MTNLKKIISNVFIFLGAVIGGGLSTGKELGAFFCEYGTNFWILNIICVIGVVLVLFLISKYNFDETNKLLEIVFFIVRFVICSTMISSLKLVCSYLPYSTIFYISFLIVFYVCMFLDFNKISMLFNFIVPIIVVSLFSVCLISLFNSTETTLPSSANFMMAINPIAYGTFNLFLLIFIVKNCLNKSTKKQTIHSILLFSVMFFLLIFVMCFAIIKNNALVESIPLLHIVNSVNSNLIIFFVFVIILAILSTFIGVCFDLTYTLKKTTHLKNNFVVNSIIFCVCLFLSTFGVDNLINYGYKFIGYFSVVYFIVIFIKLLINKKKASGSDNQKPNS